MAVQNRGESYQKIVSGVLLLGLISSVDVFAETNAYPTNAEVSFYGSMNHQPTKEKPDGKIPQRFPKQSEAIPAVSGESLKHSTSKTVDQKAQASYLELVLNSNKCLIISE